MDEYWSAIISRLADLGCLDQMNIRPAADRSEISGLEAHVGHQLPDALRDFLLVHDGQDDGPGLIFGDQLLSVQGIRTAWDNWRAIDEEEMNADCADFMASSPDGYIRPIYTNRHWIPLSHDWAGNHIGIDFDPDVKGNAGQVIRFGRDEDTKILVADGAAGFLEKFVAALQTATWNGDYLDIPDGALDVNA